MESGPSRLEAEVVGDSPGGVRESSTRTDHRGILGDIGKVRDKSSSRP